MQANKKHIQSILKLSGSDEIDDGKTRDLYRYNPVAVGQVLAEEPEYSAIACEQMKAVNSIDQINKKNLDQMKWGGLIIGALVSGPVGLMLAIGAVETGIGTATAIYYGNESEKRIAQIMSGQGGSASLEDATKLNDLYEANLKSALLSGTLTALSATKVFKTFSNEGNPLSKGADFLDKTEKANEVMDKAGEIANEIVNESSN